MLLMFCELQVSGFKKYKKCNCWRMTLYCMLRRKFFIYYTTMYKFDSSNLTSWKISNNQVTIKKIKKSIFFSLKSLADIFFLFLLFFWSQSTAETRQAYTHNSAQFLMIRRLKRKKTWNIPSRVFAQSCKKRHSE